MYCHNKFLFKANFSQLLLYEEQDKLTFQNLRLNIFKLIYLFKWQQRNVIYVIQVFFKLHLSLQNVNAYSVLCFKR